MEVSRRRAEVWPKEGWPLPQQTSWARNHVDYPTSCAGSR